MSTTVTHSKRHLDIDADEINAELTGTINTSATAVTQSTSDNSTKVSTTAYVKAQGYTGATDISSKANIASPTLTGAPLSTTPSTSDNTTKIATTAFVKAQGYITTQSDTQDLTINARTISLTNGGSVTVPAPTWASVTTKPTTFAPTIGNTSTTAMAGNTSLFDGAYTSLSSRPTTITSVQAERIAANHLKVSFPGDANYLKSNASDSFSGILTGTSSSESLKIGGIRGTAKGSQTGEYIHLYERVHIGGPSGWGASAHTAPSYGLGIHGGLNVGQDGAGVIKLDDTTIVTAARALTNVTNTNWDAAYTHSQDTHAPTNAEQNVQSDWNATSGDAFIDNKPTIPAAESYTAHESITQASSNLSNSGRTYIQSLTLDNNGHVTGATTASETVANVNTVTRVRGGTTETPGTYTSGDISFVGGSNVSIDETASGVISISSDGPTYSHPSHDGDDISIDTGALTGAVVISDLDFNVTTNTLGHVTDANASIATRSLTLANLGYSAPTSVSGNAGTATLAADSTLAGGLAIETGRNNSVNKIVRTDANGYIQAGWINTTSGANTTQTIQRVYASQDGYIRYYSLTNFGLQIGNYISYDDIQDHPTIPSGNAILDWTTDRGATNIHSGNYVNTEYVEATSSALGLVKIGYSENNKNYPVELSSGKMYVNVPWANTQIANTDTVTTVRNGDTGTNRSGTLTLVGGTNVTIAETTTGVFDISSTQSVYTHPSGAGNKHIPTGGAAGKFLKYSSSGTAVWATPSYIANSDTNKFLSGISKSSNTLTFAVSGGTDQTYTFGSNAFNSTTIPAAEQYTAHENITAATSVNGTGRTYIQDITVDSNGHVTGIATASETVVNTNTTYTKASTSALGLVSIGSGITINSAGSISVSQPSSATGEEAGLMTAADKSKIDLIEAQADKTDATNVAAAGASMKTSTETISGTKTFSAVTKISNTAASTDATGNTGALRSAGGASIAGKIYAGSTITGTADIIAYSDERLKKNVKTLDGKKVLEMRGVSFERVDNGKTSSGVIAQEMEKIAPELVIDDGNYKGVAYGNIVGYLIEAIKDQQKQIDELKAKCNGCTK